MIKFRRKPELTNGQWARICHEHKISCDATLTACANPSDGTICFDEVPGMTWLIDSFDKVRVDDAPLAGNVIGRKFDGDKPRVDLLVDGCPKALLAVSDVLTFGSKKYDDHNWKVVPNGPQRYKAALMRHILAHSAGEQLDSETNISHLAHAACCIMFMLELELTKDA